MAKKKEPKKNEPLEQTLFKAADKLRKNMDAAEYKHIVLGLIFLKYISDSFEALHKKLIGAKDEGADPEDVDEYRAENVFFVPPTARWSYLLSRAVGRKYVGEWKEGKYDGQGTETLSNGWKYVGEWREGKPWNIKIYGKSGIIIMKYVNGVEQK